MNEEMIKSILSKLPHFKGVYSFDEQRTLSITFPASYVFNTKPKHVEFGHWVAIYINSSKQGVFFDSFGRSPEFLGFHPFLAKHATSFTYNSDIVQNPLSMTCGQHVIVFLLNGKNVSKWRSLMSDNLLHNDDFVYNFVSRKFNVNVPFYPSISNLFI